MIPITLAAHSSPMFILHLTISDISTPPLPTCQREIERSRREPSARLISLKKKMKKKIFNYRPNAKKKNVCRCFGELVPLEDKAQSER